MQKSPFRMPAEYEKHKKTWILWPIRPDNWRNRAQPAQKNFLEIIKIIQKHEEITIGVTKEEYQTARNLIPQKIEVVKINYNDSWVRDNGPTIVKDKEGNLRGLNWDFNAWGGEEEGLYDDWSLDKKTASQILKHEKIQKIDIKIVNEGGAIETDGNGTLLVTENTILNKNRNPRLSKKQAEDIFKQYLGIKKTIWIKNGLYLDETGGHIDNICRFIRPRVIALAWEEDKNDPQYKISSQIFQQLMKTTDAKGNKLEVIKISQPSPQHITKTEAEGVEKIKGTYPRNEGDRMPASYVNFYIINEAVLVPIFKDTNDQNALYTYKKLFSNREIVPIPSREILLGGGNIHCITQQIPA